MMIAALLMSAALTDPYQVFGMARARWGAQHYPEKIAYTVAVDVVESGVRKFARYEAGYDAAEDTLLVDPVSDREKAHPYYVPGGFGFNVALFGQGGRTLTSISSAFRSSRRTTRSESA